MSEITGGDGSVCSDFETRTQSSVRPDSTVLFEYLMHGKFQRRAYPVLLRVTVNEGPQKDIS